MKIARIGHVGLTVPDLGSWTKFFTDIVGLQVIERDDETVYLTSSHRWAEVRLRAGEEYGCDGFGLDVAGPEAIEELIEAAPKFGLEVLDDGPAAAAERVVRVGGPSLPVIELCDGTRRAPVSYDASYPTFGPRPLKLGHVTFMSSDFEHAISVLVDYLGFRLSDIVPGVFHWYRCNADHHGIGLGEGPDVLHHFAFELSNFGQFQELGDHVVRNDHQLIWGPGRHGPGHNLFAYLLDPGGGMVEMYNDLLQIEDEANYSPSEFTLEQAGNAWGPGTIPPEAWLKAGAPYLRTSPVAG